MGFVFPLFLLAGISILIPIAIHLFNLRKYKKVEFPSVRFLRQFVVQDKRMSKVQKKLLLFSRILLLALLVIAFAQPYWSNKGNGDGKITWALYIDNSFSMQWKEGQQTLLDNAKANAINWLQNQNDIELYVIENESMFDPHLVSKMEAIQIIQNLDYSSLSHSGEDVLEALKGLKQNNFIEQLNVVLFTDFQKNIWSDVEPLNRDGNIQLFAYPLQLKENVENIWIDTAYFLETPTDPSLAIPLVSELRKSGNQSIITPFEVLLGGQPRVSKEIQMQDSDTIYYDTTMVQLVAGKWNEVELSIKSATSFFDDNYFISARIAPVNDVLIINQNNSNGYLSAGFSSQSGIRPLQKEWSGGLPTIEKNYSLIFLQGISNFTVEDAKIVKEWLENGRAVAISFAKHATVESINRGLETLGPIKIAQIDTTLQQIVDLQTSHPLMRNVLESIPENIQLPFAQYSYKIKSGITAGSQDLMRYRDGSPFISQYSLSSGKLYVFATPLDLTGGNLVQSHYFAPILHRMTVNQSNGDVYSIELFQQPNVWIANRIQNDRPLYKIVRNNFEIVPRQQSKGMGVQIFIPQNLNPAGFYHLNSENEVDGAVVGVNYTRNESLLNPMSHDDLINSLGRETFEIFNNLEQLSSIGNRTSGIPVWKWIVFLAIIAFFIEMFILSKRGVRPKVPTTE